MSWNMLAYAIPLFGGIKFLSLFDPATYRKYEQAPESIHAAVVKKIAEHVLNAENQPGMPYYERVQELLQNGSGSIHALVASRFKAISIEHKSPAFTAGVDTGVFFINIHLHATKEAIDALPWIVTHEICHILEEDQATLIGAKLVASLAATVLATLVFGWTLLPAAAAAMCANSVTHIVISRRSENRADDFTNMRCAREEKEKALAFFEQRKTLNLYDLMHPSENARIAKIKTCLLNRSSCLDAIAG